MNYKDISKIHKDYIDGKYKYDMDIPKKVSENYVFDENLSVKRNKEMVKEHNAKIDEMRCHKCKESAKLDRQFHDDVAAYIMGSCNMNKKQAEIIEIYVYAQKHTHMPDYFSAIDDVADMVEKVINAGR